MASLPDVRLRGMLRKVFISHLILEANSGLVFQQCFNHGKMALLTGHHESSRSTLKNS